MADDASLIRPTRCHIAHQVSDIVWFLLLIGLVFIAWPKPADGQVLSNFEPPLNHALVFMPGQQAGFGLDCEFYAGFMIKEPFFWSDKGGDEPSGFTYVVPEKGNPARCNNKTLPGEFQLQLSVGAEASLVGVIGSYLFLLAPAGWLYIFQASSPKLVTSMDWVTPTSNPAITVPGGLDIRLNAEVHDGCSVTDRGTQSIARAAKLAEAAGTSVPLDMCLKMLEHSPHGLPTEAIYPAILSLRGARAILRATGPASRCFDWID